MQIRLRSDWGLHFLHPLEAFTVSQFVQIPVVSDCFRVYDSEVFQGLRAEEVWPLSLCVL